MRLIPPIETYPWVVVRCRTPAGKLVLVAVLAALLWPLFQARAMSPGSPWLSNWVIAALVAATTALPAHRRAIIGAAGVVLMFARVPRGWFALGTLASRAGVSPPPALVVISLAMAFVFCGFVVVLATRFPDALLLKRPLVALLTAFVGACCAAAYLPRYLPALLSPARALWAWGFLFALAPLLWFMAYTLQDRRGRARLPLLVQLGHYQPFWGTTTTPFPKGSGYLSKIEVVDEEELAIWQLKGLKLLAWAVMLVVAHAAFRRVVYGTGPLAAWTTVSALGLPTWPLALRVPDPSWSHRWGVVGAAFFNDVFGISISGHAIIGICRMTGFKAPRNTYRPFEAVSVAEFFNRYYFYFKELLVDFFFYPTFLRRFKGRPRLRSFAATLAAAGFGNVLYHYLRDIEHLALLGPWRAALAFQPYLLYGAILGVAVGVSQLAQRRRPASWLGRRGSNLFVIAFFAVLLILSDPDRSLGIGVYLRYIVSLFNPWQYS